MKKEKKVLVLNGQYWPGYKGGGPIRSCINMIENLNGEFEFYVITSDRDFKAKESYDNVKINQWNRIGNALVYYMSENKQSLNDFQRIINSIDYDILYLNGFFSPIYTIRPLILNRLNRLKNKNIVITPRGDFSGGLEVKKFKKYLYIFIVKLIGLYKNLKWHATSTLEGDDIKRIFPNAKVITISNLASKIVNKKIYKKKQDRKVEMFFISRISEKKNLLKSLDILKRIKINGEINYDIFGPIEDKIYWEKCKELIKEMPRNITVTYKGEILHNDVANTLEKYHCLFFTTMGENYGHVIVEALSEGCLLLISDTTPWRQLEKEEIGWDIGLNNDKNYEEAINILLEMSEIEFNCRANKAVSYIIRNSNNYEEITQYINMLNNE